MSRAFVSRVFTVGRRTSDCCIMTLGKLFTFLCLYNLVQLQKGARQWQLMEKVWSTDVKFTDGSSP